MLCPFSLRVLYERSIYVLLIFAHLHLHRRRIRRDLLTAHMIEKQRNANGKSDAVTDFKVLSRRLTLSITCR